MCTKRTLLGASKNRAWSLRPEKVDLAVPYEGRMQPDALLDIGALKRDTLGW